jgi:CheY-like chemotaxis protein
VLRTVPKGTVILSIEMFGSYKESVELQLRLSDTGDGMEKEVLEKLFVPIYDEEKKRYSGLELFVAKELIALMGGEISVQSQPGKGTTFAITLPLGIPDPQNRRNYRLPAKELTNKKVFIVDSAYDSALAIKKMFAYFKHDVKIMDRERFLEKKVDLSSYDIVILDLSLFAYKKIYNYLEHLSAKEKNLKLVGLNTLLQDPKERKRYEVINRYLSKPLSQERVFELIVNLYAAQKPVAEVQKAPLYPEQKIPVHSGHIHEAKSITQASFALFRGKRLLIVEDDDINQKVLANVLKLSEMDITFANNGRIAVNTIKESDTPFDMVLMDINMPVLDGYSATQMIRKESAYDTLPIVAFTALALESEKEKIFKSGMNAYLTKPLNIGKLFTVFQLFMAVEKHEIPQTKRAVPARPYRKEILDAEKGIAYSNQNESFYIEILREFRDAYGESAELFAKLVREHRYEQLKMLCLDMKGLTGTIGAGEMYQLIMKIHHKVLYREEGMLTDYTGTYKRTLEKLKEEIARYLGE